MTFPVFSKVSRVHKLIFLLLLLIVCFHLGFAVINVPPYGDDGDNHLSWIAQFDHALEEGNNYPRWMPESLGGYGSPAFYFYPPLAYFITFGLSVITGIRGYVGEFNLVQAFACVLSTITFYFYLRHKVSNKLLVLIGALFYGFGPYRFADAYLRSAYTEHLAMAWVPLFFWGLELAIESKTTKQHTRAILTLTVSAMLLTLTSIPVTILVLFATPVYLLPYFIQNRNELPKLSLILGSVGLLTFIVLGIYLLPIISLREYIQTHHLEDTFGHSKYAFVLLDVWKEFWHLTRISLLLLLIGGAAFFVVRRSDNALLRGITYLLGLCIFLQLPIVSVPVWNLLSPLKLVQFSWRWDVLLTFCVGVCIAYADNLLAGQWFKYSLVVILVYVVVAYGFWSVKIYNEKLPAVATPTDEAIEYAPREAIGSKWRLLSFIRSADSLPELTPLRELDKAESVQLTSRTGSITNAQVDLKEPTRLSFHRFFWPYWRLYMLKDREENTLKTFADSNGVLCAELPAGKYRLELSMQEPEVVKSASIISLIGVTILALLGLYAIPRGRKKQVR